MLWALVQRKERESKNNLKTISHTLFNKVSHRCSSSNTLIEASSSSSITHLSFFSFLFVWKQPEGCSREEDTQSFCCSRFGETIFKESQKERISSNYVLNKCVCLKNNSKKETTQHFEEGMDINMTAEHPPQWDTTFPLEPATFEEWGAQGKQHRGHFEEFFRSRRISRQSKKKTTFVQVPSVKPSPHSSMRAPLSLSLTLKQKKKERNSILLHDPKHFHQSKE